jgi:uncharacterized protein (TIGR00369 family)
MKLISAPIARLIGFKIEKAQKGVVTCVLRAGKKHENTRGTMHGGVLCDLADAAMGYAFLTCLAKGQSGVTVELKISFLKPVRRGDTLRAEAKTLSRGKSLYFLECEIRNRGGELAAKASATCKVTSPKV